MSSTDSSKSVHVVLAGSSGVPGRSILRSLRTLISQLKSPSTDGVDVKLTVLKRSSSTATKNHGDAAASGSTTSTDEPYQTVYVGDFGNVPVLSQSLQALDPDIVVSALNAEPAPVLDNHLVDALLLMNRVRRGSVGVNMSSVPGSNLGAVSVTAGSTPEDRRNSYYGGATVGIGGSGGQSGGVSGYDGRRMGSSSGTGNLNVNTQAQAALAASLQQFSLQPGSTSGPHIQPVPAAAQVPSYSRSSIASNQTPAHLSNDTLPQSSNAPRQPVPRKPVLFINGYTLDLLHPSIPSTLPPSSLTHVGPKIEFAHRLHSLAQTSELEYVTIVCAGFLDYTLMKGYTGLDLTTNQATVYGPTPDTLITGSSLTFVGDVVAKIVETRILSSFSFPSSNSNSTTTQANEIYESILRNKRLRIAETPYSARKLIDAVESVTGQKIDIVRTVDLDTMKRDDKRVILYLNWAGEGASGFFEDGLGVFAESGGNGGDNRFVVHRRTLQEIVKKAIDDGAGVF